MPPMPPSPAGPVLGKGPATPLKPGAGGKLTSAKSRSGNPACSQAMSAFQLILHGKPAGMSREQATAQLGRCRSEAHGLRRAEANRGAGNEGKAQHIEHRVRTAQQSGGPITQKDRRAKALALIAGRRAKQQASVREQAAGTLKPTKSRNVQDRVKRIQDRVYATQQHVADNPTDERAKRFLSRIRGNESLAPSVARDMAAGKPGYFSRFRARNAKPAVTVAKPAPEPAGFSTSHAPRKGVTDRATPGSIVEPWKKAEALKSRAANPRGNVWQRLAKFRDKSALTADAMVSAGRKDAAVRAQKRLWQVNWAVKGKGTLPKFGREDYASPQTPDLKAQVEAHRATKGTPYQRFVSLWDRKRSQVRGLERQKGEVIGEALKRKSPQGQAPFRAEADRIQQQRDAVTASRAYKGLQRIAPKVMGKARPALEPIHPGDVSQAHAAPTGSASNTVKRSTHDLIALTREAKATLPRADRTSFVRGLAASRGKTMKVKDTWKEQRAKNVVARAGKYGSPELRVKSAADEWQRHGARKEGIASVAPDSHGHKLLQAYNDVHLRETKGLNLNGRPTTAPAGVEQSLIEKGLLRFRYVRNPMNGQKEGKTRITVAGRQALVGLNSPPSVSTSLKQQAAAHRATKGSARERIGALMAKNDMASRALDTGSLTGKGAKIRRIRKNTAKLDRMLRQTPRPRPSQGRYDSSD